MNIPAGKPADLQVLLDELLPACLEVADERPADTASEGSLLVAAFRQLLEVMTRIDSDTASGRGGEPGEITEIGEYALQLHGKLAALAARAGVREREDPLAAAAVGIAFWVAGHGGRIDTLEPVVDGLAHLANSLRDPAQLEALSRAISAIIDAVSPLISEDLEKVNPGRPWRVLLLNHCIVATRSHNTELMEQAFGVLTGRLPEDAAGFFSAGMQQMEALDYPSHVRKVMERYHRQWTVNRALH